MTIEELIKRIEQLEKKVKEQDKLLDYLLEPKDYEIEDARKR